jgi:PAS domain-containing protein
MRIESTSDVQRDAMVRRVAERAPLALAVYLVCVGISTVFEAVRFPERRWPIAVFAAASVVVAALMRALLAVRPRWALLFAIAFANAGGVAINLYHAAVGALVAISAWMQTALLAGCVVLMPWGRRSQALASIGSVLSYPILLASEGGDPLAWAAGGVYVVAVVVGTTLAASLFEAYAIKDLDLTATLEEREARLQNYFDLSLVGTAIVDADGRCLEVNEELCRILGATDEELVGARWDARLDPHDRLVAVGLLAQAIAGAPERMDLRCARRRRPLSRLSPCGAFPARRATDHAMVLMGHHGAPPRRSGAAALVRAHRGAPAGRGGQPRRTPSWRRCRTSCAPRSRPSWRGPTSCRKAVSGARRRGAPWRSSSASRARRRG